jgi:hypothetical protein
MSKIQFRAKWAGPGELKGGRRKRVGYSRVSRGSKRCRGGEELWGGGRRERKRGSVSVLRHGRVHLSDLLVGAADAVHDST